MLNATTATQAATPQRTPAAAPKRPVNLPTVFEGIIGTLTVEEGRATFAYEGQTYEVRAATFALHANMPLELTAELLGQLKRLDEAQAKVQITGQVGKPKGGPHYIVYIEELGILQRRAA